MGFLISFLVPYYIVYSVRTVEEMEDKPPPGPPETLTFYHGRTMYVVSNRWWTRLLGNAFEAVIRLNELRSGEHSGALDPVRARKKVPPTRREVHFDLSPEEQRYATWIAQEIEAIWGFERMPPEVGNVLVYDVATNSCSLGAARLYDCLFTDHR